MIVGLVKVAMYDCVYFYRFLYLCTAIALPHLAGFTTVQSTIETRREGKANCPGPSNFVPTTCNLYNKSQGNSDRTI